MSNIKLNQKLQRLEISDFEIENELVFKYFDDLPAKDRSNKFLKAIYIGVLAQMEDRLSSFLARTSNELGTELENLKLLFDMKQEVFYKTSLKGGLAEEHIAEFLSDLVVEQNMNDTVHMTGNTGGKLNKNKTGDIVCRVEGIETLKIIIECKFDKSIKLGEIENKDIFTRKTDTVWSQLIEAQANREGKVSIIVLDYSSVDNKVLSTVQNVRFLPEVGFIAIVNSQKGDFTNLAIAYFLARDIATKARPIELDKNILTILINRIIKDLKDAQKIKILVQGNIENNKKILEQLEKSMLMMSFSQKYLLKFLEEGTLTKEDLLSFYSAEEVNDEYKLIHKEISML